MQVVVLWEDQRGAQAKGFGPHELLLSCLADDGVGTRDQVKSLITSIPLKGSGNVYRELRSKAGKILASGQLFVVFDRDKTNRLWSPGEGVPDCMLSMTARLKKEAPGDYDIVFLHDNMETLLRAAALSLNAPISTTKPTPDERDRLLGRLAWGSLKVRTETRNDCPSFDRLVRHVASVFPEPLT